MVTSFGKVKIVLTQTMIRLFTVIFIKYNSMVYYFIKICFCTLKIDTENADLGVLCLASSLCVFAMLWCAWLHMISCMMLLDDLTSVVW